MDNVITQYLNRYAEPETQSLTFISTRYQYVLVVPAFAEHPGFIDAFANRSFSNTLLILVINSPDRLLSTEEHQSTEVLFQHLMTHYPVIAHNTHTASIKLHSMPRNNACLVIDRSFRTRPIPPAEGVGCARKIGLDCAAWLFSRGKIASPYLFSTDADALLPDGYFQSSALPDKPALINFAFEHQHNPGSFHYIAGLLYDLSLRYYVAGLSFAGLPYAFHTIGSTFAPHVDHYCQVRGMPKRAGGEDFYFINKIIKTGHVYSSETTIQLAIRDSTRVPFGTGPAVIKINNLSNSISDYQYYAPEIFYLLKQMVDQLPVFYQENIITKRDSAAISIFNSKVLEGLYALGFQKAVTHFTRQSSNYSSFLQHFYTWFDGFRCLKLVHFLRKHYYPSVNLDALLSAPEWKAILAQHPTVMIALMQQLNQARN